LVNSRYKDHDERTSSNDKLPRASIMDDSNKCGNCLYWKRKGNTMTGKCHRHAPKRIPSKDNLNVNDWAVTNEEDFCGDFAPHTPRTGPAEKRESLPIREIFTPQQQRLPIEDTQRRQ
jgi:hypothetical protein